METSLYRIKHNLTNPNFLGAPFESDQAERYSPSWRHPSSITPVTWDQLSPVFSLGIFTDGSKINGQVGAAFNVFDPAHTGDFQFRLDNHCSVFQAELTAIKLALLWKQSHKPSTHSHLFTDSMSSLNALQKFKPNSNLVEEIQGLIDGTISLHWVGLLLKEWQERWNRNDAKGRYTYSIFPKVSTKRCVDNHLLSQVLTNHSLCPQYLKRFNLRACNCRCGEDTDDGIQHYLFWCPLLDSRRSLRRPGMPIPKILQNKNQFNEVISILNFLFGHQQDIFEEDT
ncbi:hypothetical protein AVEN_125371-1 [Araneus ventricosus]|uniref:RNase H type-1 domain-containing protein n=1 Tax=Araneus ventricosus TaxID=182803 RepID=A0A4Y2TEM3_ARAVE|nr:hypothetical protein AVEN_125371-1 [Araneus ventricosus]